MVGETLKKMKLHLIRHAKTEPFAASGKDFDRALLPKGVVQSNALGVYLEIHLTETVEVFCSSAKRTRQTFAILDNYLKVSKKTYLDDLYLCDREQFLALIWKLNHKNDLVIIGHNDGISQFASYLTDEYIHMKTSAYVCLEFKLDSWKEVSMGTATLLAHYRPQVVLPLD